MNGVEADRPMSAGEEDDRPMTEVEADRPMNGVEDVYPLSPMQEGMLFHTLYAPDSGVYVTQVNLGFTDHDLDLPAFERSWREVLERHAALRTFFAWEGLETPIQAVEREVELPVERLDWRRLPAADGQERLAAYLRAERTRRFDLTRPPLLRLGLLRLPGGLCQVVWTFHHLILDGWSVGLVLRDVEAIYRSLAGGRAGLSPRLPPVRPFRDYIVWLQRQDLTLAERHWRAALRGFTSPTPLPFDRDAGRASRALEGYAVQRTLLAAGVTSALAAWARRGGLTLNTLAQGVWSLLLSRYSGQADVAFGAAVLGRPADLEGSESMVGLFINTLLMRADAAAGAVLLPWLQELQASWTRTRRFEHSPLVEVQGWSEVPRGVPLFESVVNFGGSPSPAGGRPRAAERPAGGGWEVETLGQTNVAVTLDVTVGTELGLHLRYDRERFGDVCIRRLLGHLATLFAELPGEPRRRLSELALLPAAERQQVVLEWNDTVVPRAGDALLHGRFERLARTAPGAVALVCDGRTVTYGELDALAGGLAGRLRALGTGPGSRVGVFMERSAELVVALLAVLKAGGAYLPLDPEHPRERLAFLLADGEVAAVLASPALGGRLPAHGVPGGLPPVHGALGAGSPAHRAPAHGAPVLEVDLAELRAAYQAAGRGGGAPERGAAPDDLAYVLYTSGSTGRPKGVMVSHRAICNRLDWMQDTYRLAAGDRVLQKTPFGFDVSVWEFFWPLSVGARLVVAPPGVHREPARLLELIGRERITTAHFVPSMLHYFLETPGIEAAACLRRVICSGEALGHELQERFHAALPASLHNLYGPTEAAVDVTYWPCERDGREEPVPIGWPIANTRIHLLDAGLRPAPIGAVAELCIGGVCLARGYLGRPGLTAARFVPDAFATAPGERLYRTGDLARRRPDGSVDFLGRIDLQVKVRGIRIELGEIEGVLASHPDVLQAAVAAWEDGPAGQRLVAYVVPRPGAVLPVDDLLSRARELLPEAMVPSAMVLLEALPLTVSGKLDRRALPAPGPGRPGAPELELVAPRDELEAELAAIWEEVLQARPIGVRDDFFALGGHSLLAVRLVGMLHQRFGKRLDVARLVEARTIERLARLLRGPVAPAARRSLAPLQPEGARLPFFCIHPIGGQVLCYADLARHFGPDQPVYGLQAPGLEEVGEAAPAIEEMAASYLAAVRRLQPAGPYLIGGWSMGGIVAFELARQLRAGGEEAALVAILDSWSPDIHRKVPDDSYLLAEIVKDQALQQGIASAVSHEQLRGLDPEARLHRVLEEGRRAGLVSADVGVSWLRRLLQGYRARREALQRYRPASYPGRLTLFRAAEEDAEFLRTLETEIGIDVRDPALGWGAFSTETVAVERVPGNHSTMCMEPNARALADSLRAWIELSTPSSAARATALPARLSPLFSAPTARQEDS